MKHLLKISFLLMLMACFFACDKRASKEEKQLKDIQLNLESRVAFGHFYPQRELANSVEAEEVQLKNIPTEFTDYEIKSFTFNLAQDFYQDYKNGKISAEEFNMLQQIYTIDTTQLSTNNKASKVYLTIGEVKNGNRAVVVDTNLDLDLEGEEVHEFEYPIQFIDEDDEAFYEKNKVQFLPKAKVQHGESEDEEFVLLLDPYEGDMSRNSNTEKYFLSMSIPHIKTQTFQVEDKTFVLEAKSNFTQVETNPKQFQFLVFEKKDSTEVATNLLRFNLNDTINLNNYDFKLSYTNKEFSLENLGFNEKPTGVTEGFYLPEIKTDYIDGKPYSNEAYRKKFQLLYFWTTWSLPSLEDIAKLKKLQEEHEKLAVVGVAVDANQGAVERMIVRQEMNWKNLYAANGTKESKNPALQFKVMSFPTYILVNEEQKIVKRTHHLKEVVDVLGK